MIRQWNHLSTKDIAAMDKDRSLVIVPVGATEQHGAHLPVGTDSIILGSLLHELEQKADFSGYTVLIAPLIPVGKSNEHLDFPGTLSFSTATMYGMVDDLCGSIRAHGFGKTLLMNSHGGNTDLLNVLSRDLRIKHDMEVFVFDWWFTSFWNDILAKVQQSGEYGVFHACELETSLMLAFRPDLVDMAQAADEYPPAHLTDNRHVSIKGPIIPGWKTQDVSKHGVIGAPTLASAEKGRVFIDYAVAKLQEMIAEVIRTSYKAGPAE